MDLLYTFLFYFHVVVVLSFYSHTHTLTTHSHNHLFTHSLTHLLTVSGMLRMTARSMTAARVDSSMSVPRNIACAAFSALCRNSHALTCARTCTCAFRTRTCTCSRRGLSTSSDTGTGTGSAAKQRVLSGIQPTGKLHIGNYAGETSLQ